MTCLLLAGSGEARRIAQFCADQGVQAVATLAGATRHPKPLALQTFSGGFGGEAGFESFLETHTITRVLDMTHPFASQISTRSALISQRKGLNYLRYERPAWAPSLADNWTFVTSETDVRDHITTGSTVFLATGRQTLHRFDNLSDCTLICRQIDPPDGPFPFPNGRFEIGRPPFSVDDEVRLFEELKVDVLVTKNAGGSQSRSKLDAARQLALPVVMIDRPQDVPGDATDDLERVKTWLLAGS